MSIRELYRQWRRFRTPLLAVLATALLVWSTVYIFDVPAKEVLAFLAVSVGGLLVIMLLALGVSWLLARFRG